MTETLAPEHLQNLIARGALFVINHSGGKDSQAMAATVRRLVPESQIVVVHAHLAGVEWEDVIEHIYHDIDDLPLHVVRAGKTFFEMVERRGKFPSPQIRQCTGDLKRDPIAKLIRGWHRETGQTIFVNCMGLRAEESPGRAKKVEWSLDRRASKAGREVWTWLPIHGLLVAEVFATIAAAGKRPHWAYAAGMTRLSCCFCIMASDADLRVAARHNPEMYRQYIETEDKLGFTMRMDGTRLQDVVEGTEKKLAA